VHSLSVAVPFGGAFSVKSSSNRGTQPSGLGFLGVVGYGQHERTIGCANLWALPSAKQAIAHMQKHTEACARTGYTGKRTCSPPLLRIGDALWTRPPLLPAPPGSAAPGLLPLGVVEGMLLLLGRHGEGALCMGCSCASGC